MGALRLGASEATLSTTGDFAVVVFARTLLGDEAGNGGTGTDFVLRAVGLAGVDARFFGGCARLPREDSEREDSEREDSAREAFGREAFGREDSGVDDERGARETIREETGISSTRLIDNDVIEMSESKLIVP